MRTTIPLFPRNTLPFHFISGQDAYCKVSGREGDRDTEFEELALE